MRTIAILLQKEFLQIRRNKLMLPIILVMPIMQMLVLAFAANYEITDIGLVVLDEDRSPLSRSLINTLGASEYFQLRLDVASENAAFEAMQRDAVDIILQIPPGAEESLMREQSAKLLISADAINGVKAGVGVSYLNSILIGENRKLAAGLQTLSGSGPGSYFEIRSSDWYNPNLSFQNYFVPGILAVLITIIGMFLAAVNIVREKELGTIEQINVTPIRKSHFIIGKLLPFWIIGMFDLVLGLFVAKLVFNIPMVGSFVVLFGFVALYLLVVLGMGLFISTFTDTQQQAMFIAWFCMVIFILMGGLFTPIESMPDWAQKVTEFNPVAYCVEVMRMVLLKGSGFADLQTHFLRISAFAVLANVFAIWNYRKTS